MVDRARLDQLLALLAGYVRILRELATTPVAAMLQPMARMRNRLAHHYEDIAAERVHEILGSQLDDFDRFAEQITAYADRS